MLTGLDHVVLTVRDLEAARRFYCDGLGLEMTEFERGRHALNLGHARINLHVHDDPATASLLKAAKPEPGSADWCFLTDRELPEVADRMTRLGYPVVEGPVPRSGARGPILSLYFRDPDGALIEVATYDPEGMSGPGTVQTLRA